MLKKIRFEILIIGILFLSILISYSFKFDSYDYSSYFRGLIQQIYLIKFFEHITILGDSLWYFLISITFIIVCFLFIKFNVFHKYEEVFKKIQFYNFLLFSSILSSGIITQIIKHILGRPRPNTLNFENEVSLNFFTLDSNFHSFPSGHTSTIFVVALVVSLIAPKLKYFFFFLALVISFSRVVVGAHFITDIIGGIAVAFIGFKISKFILSKTLNKNEVDFQFSVINNNFKLIIFFFLLLSVFLAVGPTFDIFFSDLFHIGSSHLGKNFFVIQSYYYTSFFFRKIILGLILIYILLIPIVSLITPIKKIYCNYSFKMKDILYIWISTLVSLIVLINIIFKNMWGRARPNDILELGGVELFTPWYQISNQCASNCSFVSGDAAVGFSLIIFYFLIRKEIYIWLALFFGFTIGIIRIMEGGHFISDVIFSCLIVFLFNLLIYPIYSKKIDG